MDLEIDNISNLYNDVIYINDKNFFEETIDERNLSEIEAIRTITEIFKQEINKLTVYDKGEAEIQDTIKISKSKSFVVPYTDEYISPRKSVFNKMVFDSHFEYEFASFLDGRSDIRSFVKNFDQINFRIEYQDIEKNIHWYTPDFIIKLSSGDHWIIETKGVMTRNDELKHKRLEQWCNDVNKSGKIKEKWNCALLMESKWRELTKIDLPNTFKDFIKLIK